MNKTILIVEDEHHYHELYKMMLENTEYEIIHAYDGDEALSKLHEKKPDVIILDMLMDMVTGDTLLLYLKSMPECKNIPIIIISACSEKEYKYLRELDNNLIYIEKSYITEEKLLNELEKKWNSLCSSNQIDIPNPAFAPARQTLTLSNLEEQK